MKLWTYRFRVIDIINEWLNMLNIWYEIWNICQKTLPEKQPIRTWHITIIFRLSGVEWSEWRAWSVLPAHGQGEGWIPTYLAGGFRSGGSWSGRWMTDTCESVIFTCIMCVIGKNPCCPKSNNSYFSYSYSCTVLCWMYILLHFFGIKLHRNASDSLTFKGQLTVYAH